MGKAGMTSTIARRRQRGALSVAARDRVATSNYSQRASAAASASREVLPASGSSWRPEYTAPWIASVSRRIMELASRPPGWDSYGGDPLHPDAVDPVVELLSGFGSAIQTAPSISLTSDGGLLLQWNSGEASIDFTTHPSQPAEVYYAEVMSGKEWEGPASECSLLEKWLWRASSMV